MLSYHINRKVSFIVTDNASNMKKAFNTAFPSDREEQDAEIGNGDDTDDDEELWQENDDLSVERIETERISCFAHSLQLCVNDGLKETRVACSAMAKLSRVSELLHKSGSYKVCVTSCTLNHPVKLIMTLLVIDH